MRWMLISPQLSSCSHLMDLCAATVQLVINYAYVFILSLPILSYFHAYSNMSNIPIMMHTWNFYNH